MKISPRITIILMILIIIPLASCVDKPIASDKIPWNLNLLNKAPAMKWLVHEGPLYSLEYQGLPNRGKETRVFAYYATPGSISGKPASDKDLPGIILLHAGGAHANPVWVRQWARFGYAALSIDLSGCGPDLKLLPNAVPADNLLSYDWNYHAVANVILAHSLLLSFKEVNADRTAVTGISVGGQLTDIVAGLDKRFKVASSVYGCGYLYENSLFSERLSQMEKAERDKWVKAFDPSSYLGSVTIPIMFATGANDPHYPLDSYVKSYKLVKGPRNYCIVPGIPHVDVVGMNLIAPVVFIDQFCKNGIPLPSIERPEVVNGKVQAKIQCKTKPVKASLYYTTDTCTFKDRKWNSIDAAIVGSTIISPEPPGNTTAWLMALTDVRNATVSSEVIFK